VGIRASKIQAYDGSEIIYLNGDLLSQKPDQFGLYQIKREE